MGLSWSRQDIYIHEFCNPFSVEKLKQSMISTDKPSSNPFASLISPHEEKQRAVILGIYLLFVCNETYDTCTIQMSGLFEPKKTTHRNEDVGHPDETGTISIICPAQFNGPITENDRILYRPRLKDEYIRKYAGLEEAIMKPQSVLNNGRNVYEETNPIVSFIIDHSDHLKPALNSDFVRHNGGFYEIGAAFLERVQRFFEHTIFDSIRYTRFDQIQFMGGVRKERISFILQMNYLLITPGELKMKHKEILL